MNSVAANEVTSNVGPLFDALVTEKDRGLVDRLALRHRAKSLDLPEADRDATLPELLLLGLGADRFIGPSDAHFARGCLHSVGDDLKALSALLDSVTEELSADVSHMLHRLSARCFAAAELDKRIEKANASPVAAPMRLPNLERALQFNAHASTPRAWPNSTVVVARNVEWEDVPVDEWPARLDRIDAEQLRMKAEVDAEVASPKPAPAPASARQANAKTRHKVIAVAARRGRTTKKAPGARKAGGAR